MPRNPCGKTVKRADAYEIWISNQPCVCHGVPSHADDDYLCPSRWTWYVLKKWQIDDDKLNARWFCDVVTSIVPHGELGDVYVRDIKRFAHRVFRQPFLSPDNVTTR